MSDAGRLNRLNGRHVQTEVNEGNQCRRQPVQKATAIEALIRDIIYQLKDASSLRLKVAPWHGKQPCNPHYRSWRISWFATHLEHRVFVRQSGAARSL